MVDSSAAMTIKTASTFENQFGYLLKTPPFRWHSPYDCHASHKIRRIKSVDAYHERGKIICITITMRMFSRRTIVSQQSLIFQCPADPPNFPTSRFHPEVAFPCSKPTCAR